MAFSIRFIPDAGESLVRAGLAERHSRRSASMHHAGGERHDLFFTE
jgi:hypothetical protein